RHRRRHPRSAKPRLRSTHLSGYVSPTGFLEWSQITPYARNRGTREDEAPLENRGTREEVPPFEKRGTPEEVPPLENGGTLEKELSLESRGTCGEELSLENGGTLDEEPPFESRGLLDEEPPFESSLSGIPSMIRKCRVCTLRHARHAPRDTS
ncbi:unnamed protein product, partial [Ectocarpus sp. 13 AM-2016]